MIKIENVLKNSVSEELGIKPGDFLVSINRSEPVDRLDMIFLDAKRKFRVEIQKSNGEKEVFVFKKADDEKLGLELEGFDEIKTKWCSNHCIFCFVDQLPKNLRKTLYVKDDDWRLSFVSGNYVTLTNLTKADEKRIIKEKISPLYVSVHATDENVRNHLLGRKKSRNIMSLLKKFSRAKITVHTQAVLCEGINDGLVLEKTMKDLFSLSPYVKSLALVPVGLSCHRENLAKLKTFSVEGARHVVEVAQSFDKTCKEKTGDNFVFPSDEFFLQANLPFPEASEYGDYDQIENGVGLVRKFESEFLDALENSEKKAKNGEYSLITGKSAENLLKTLANKFYAKHKNVKIDVIAIENEFFGKTVTVAGLVVAKDILKQTQNITLLKNVVIPHVMLREIENVFLDDTSLEEFKDKIKRNVIVSGNDGDDLFDILMGEKK